MAERYTIHELCSGAEKGFIADELYELLRGVERREIEALTDDVRKEVQESIFSSDECWAAFGNGHLITVWGIRKVKGVVGRLIWCLSTSRIDEYWLSFAGRSRKILWEWVNRYGLLYNSVADFNRDSIRWLQWCGAAFGKAQVVNGVRFLPFSIEKGDMDDVQRNGRADRAQRVHAVPEPAAGRKSTGGDVPSAGGGRAAECED